MTLMMTAFIMGCVTYLVYVFTRKSRVDTVIEQITIQPKSEEIKEISEIAKLEQEIRDGKIDYAGSRARLNELRASAAKSTEGT